MRWLTILLVLCAALPAAAQALDTKQARKDLFSLRGYSLVVSDRLSKKDAATVKGVVPLMAEQLRQPVRYYAAIAWSPRDGLVHDSLQAAMNFHTVGAASRAAVAACGKLKSSGAPSCEVAAIIVPKGFKPRGLTLSLDATAAFDKAFRRAPAPKSFAISSGTGGWGIGASDQAAVRACAENSGANDCSVVIRE